MCPRSGKAENLSLRGKGGKGENWFDGGKIKESDELARIFSMFDGTFHVCELRPAAPPYIAAPPPHS